MYNIFDAYKKHLNHLFCSIVIVFVLFFIILRVFKTEETVSLPATIISETKHTIKSQIKGDIEKIYFKNGDRVNKNDVLFTYSRQSIKQNIIEIEYIINEKINFKNQILKTAFEIIYYYELNIDSLNSKLNYLSSQLEYSNSVYKAKEELHKQGGISLDELNKQKFESDRLAYEYDMLIIEKENYNRSYNLNIEILNSYGISTINMENVTLFIDSINEEINSFRDQTKIYKNLLNEPYVLPGFNRQVQHRHIWQKPQFLNNFR
jgi:multidrug resistance efflux pump